MTLTYGRATVVLQAKKGALMADNTTVVTMRFSDEDLELADFLVQAWQTHNRSLPNVSSVRRGVTRSSAMRDLLWAWAMNAQMPERPVKLQEGRS
jgi:hypothetical protein